MSKITWEWLAGFWEADGSVYTYLDKKKSKDGKIYHALRVSICQQDLKLLQRIESFLYVHNIKGSLQKYRHKDNCYDLRLSTRQAERFIQKIFPHIVSQREINRVLEAFSNVNQSPGIKRGLQEKYTWNEKKAEKKCTKKTV